VPPEKKRRTDQSTSLGLKSDGLLERLLTTFARLSTIVPRSNTVAMFTSMGRFLASDTDPVATASCRGGGDPVPGDIVGASPAFLASMSQLRRVANSEAPVLIEGETGSGKELAARAVHDWGNRRSGPFVPVNCGAPPNHLVEAELFGHERGRSPMQGRPAAAWSPRLMAARCSWIKSIRSAAKPK